MVNDAIQKALRALPSVEELAGKLLSARQQDAPPRTLVVQAARVAVENARTEILSGCGPTERQPEDLVAVAAALLDEWEKPGLRRVANLSGVVVHTNLGRSPLAKAAIDRVVETAYGYCNLEYDLAAGARGNRETHVEHLLTRLTGAEAAFVVNNNAGAVLLLLMALAGGRDVLVSRGQLVEIGGSFRLPDIMRAGGTRLVEVGTTNRTRLEDFEQAIGPESALLLRVHTSNYRVIGFTEEPELAALVELGHGRGLLVADDLGSGALYESEIFRDEPTVAASLRTGVDVVCFSGDKLLGGPQAGILVGKTDAIWRLRKHPAARALRMDKMSLAALEATLALYVDPARAAEEIPSLRFLGRTPAETLALATQLQAALEGKAADGFIIEVEETVARAGGGSLPLAEFPSHAVRIRFPELPILGGAPGGTARPAGTAGRPEWSASTEPVPLGGPWPTVSALDAELRRAPLPVVARVAQDSLHLDVVALDEKDLPAAAESVIWALGRLLAGNSAHPGMA